MARVMAADLEKRDLESRSTDECPIQLNWELRDGHVVVTPSDGDRFIVKVDKAIEILRRNQVQREQFKSQFKLLTRQLAHWISQHREKVDQAYLTAGEQCLRFIVVRHQVRFDADLTDDLSELSYRIANDSDLDMIKLNARALPLADREDISSFLDEEFIIPFHGK